MEYQFNPHQTQTGKIATNHKFPKLSGGLFPESNSESSVLGLSVGIPAGFKAAPPPESKFSLFLQDMDSPGAFPCTMEAIREAIFRVAAMQPIPIDDESLRSPPERKNVRISKDPQSVAARRRRERISHRIRVLQRMVPGGTKLDTASMLDEAAHYLRFLKKQVQSLEQAAATGNYRPTMGAEFFPVGHALD